MGRALSPVTHLVQRKCSEYTQSHSSGERPGCWSRGKRKDWKISRQEGLRMRRVG